MNHIVIYIVKDLSKFKWLARIIKNIKKVTLSHESSWRFNKFEAAIG